MNTFTKFMPPAYLAAPQIAPHLDLVERHFYSASEQHPARKWEYGMALAAAVAWVKRLPAPSVLDVGGAGSPLAAMLAGYGFAPLVVDPSTAPESGFVGDIEAYAKATPRPHVSAIFSISVLEHVPGVPHFLAACDKVLLEGGLLFLTVDAWDPPANAAEVPPHFAWMRERIYTPVLLRATVDYIKVQGYTLLGGAEGEADYTWHGPGVYNYGFFSMAFVKTVR